MAGAGRTEDGKERDPNQSSSKMDGARRGMEKRWRREGGFNRSGSVEKDAGKEGRSGLEEQEEEEEVLVVLTGAVRPQETGWRSSRLLDSPPRPARSIRCAVTGHGAA